MTITPIGVYRVHPDEKAFKDAMGVQGDADYVQREFENLVLVELKIDDLASSFDIGKFKQPHTEYVPYDETYLDCDSHKVIGGAFKPPRVNRFIVVFYLHFYDPSKPLRTPRGDIILPSVSEIPSRLAWKHYSYWD
jgi:hypothetical protein